MRDLSLHIELLSLPEKGESMHNGDTSMRGWFEGRNKKYGRPAIHKTHTHKRDFGLFFTYSKRLSSEFEGK